MAVQYKIGKYDTVVQGESLTEQEHKDSCDINLMLKSIDRGQMVRGGGSQEYGYDDTTMDAVQLRILKANLEEALLNGQKEFSKEELDLFPNNLQEKFGLKLKKEAAQLKSKNNEPNDETDEEAAPQQSKKPKKPKTPPVEDEE